MEHLTLFAQDIGKAFTALPKAQATGERIQTAIELTLMTLGILAVLMVVIGAIRYAASRGEPDQVATAKNTIIYALVGLIIAMFALVIVRFVTGRLL
jgi:hypothetical protein